MKKKTLLDLRQEKKIKQRTIMEMMNIDRKTLYNWEHCRTAPDHWQLQTLCNFYAVKKETIQLAERYDPLYFLPDDKTYEEWKREHDAFVKEQREWWDATRGRPWARGKRKNRN